MRVTILIENTKSTCSTIPLKCEHGLSFFIEFQGRNYLLDAGTTDSFIENAKLLNVPIWNVKTCILSHGHYDHSGGFGRYLRENKEAKLYMMHHAIDDYYSGSGGIIHEIGIPKEVIKEHKGRFIFVDDMMKEGIVQNNIIRSDTIQRKGENEVLPSKILCSESIDSYVIRIEEKVYIVPHNTSNLEQIGANAKLYRKEDNMYLSDDFSHELSLVFDTSKGLVIFNSCSHGGIKNILQEVQEAFASQKEDKKIYAFFGGLHMKGKKEGIEICTFSEKEIRDLISYGKQIGMKYLYTGHCTGAVGIELLKKYGGELVRELRTGSIIDIE